MKLCVVIDEESEHVLEVMMREILLSYAQKKGVSAEIFIGGESSGKKTLPQMFPQVFSAGSVNASKVVLLYISARPYAAMQEDIQKNIADFHVTALSALPDDVTNRTDILWERIVAASQGSTAAGGTENNIARNADKPPHNAAGRAHKIVAVTSCPTGIAHTFMAAEALTEAAQMLHIAIRVETQGSVGAQTKLTAQEIQDADLVIIAADREVARDRFDGKRVYVSGTKAAIANGKNYIENAMQQAQIQNAAKSKTTAATQNGDADQSNNGEQETQGKFYRPLMTGISFMLPFVVAGGLLIALGLALGGINVAEQTNTFAYFLWQTGAQGAFPLIVPILAGYIAFAIADRPGLAPGMVGGLIANQIDAGFLGGIAAGFLAGYITKTAARTISLPRALEGLKPVLVLPLLCTALTGLIMFYIIQSPTAWLLHSLTDWVRGLESHSDGMLVYAALLGAIIGGMMAVDMGGPVNKAAYAVAIGLLAEKVYTPMAASMIGGMTPPMALALACGLRPQLFTQKERDSKAATFIMGTAFISEGAIPFASRDPLRIIPCLIAGSAVAGMIALVTATGIVAPHGGIFLLPIKNAIINYGGYFAALICGTLVSAACLCFFCRTVPQKQQLNQESVSSV